MLVLLLLQLAFLAVAEEKQEYYILTVRCGIAEDDVIVTRRGNTYCGSLCLSHNNCSGFRYTHQGPGNCFLYQENSITGSSPCSENDANFLEVFVQEKLVPTQNNSLPTGTNTSAANTTVNTTASTNNSSGVNATTNSTSSGVDTTCANGGIYNSSSEKCVCTDGWVGDQCNLLLGDCSALQGTGKYTEHGVYMIQPTAAPQPFQVYCYMNPTSGLTQIQAHLSESRSLNRSWEDYKQGFNYSHLLTDYWLGNDYIHYITQSHSQTLLFDIKNNSGTNYRIYYNNFIMGSEADNYAISFSSTSSVPAGLECWQTPPSSPFSTYDRDNDGDPNVNCAALHGGGWWFEPPNCTLCNLNGKITSNQDIRQGDPSELFVLPIDPEFSPEYVLMALYWLP